MTQVALTGENGLVQRGTGFRACPCCDGRGFVRRGDFADRSFPRCDDCKGIGQIYLDPVLEKVW